MAHQEKMKNMQQKYLERKIQKIDHFGNSFNREEDQSSRSKTPSDNISNMMTRKVKHIPHPKKNKLKSDDDFSFMPTNKQITPKNYEKQFRNYIENKKFFLIFRLLLKKKYLVRKKKILKSFLSMRKAIFNIKRKLKHKEEFL